MAAACERDLPLADALNKTVAGVGPVVCREAAWRAFDGEHLLANELTEEQKRKPYGRHRRAEGSSTQPAVRPAASPTPAASPSSIPSSVRSSMAKSISSRSGPSFNAMLEGYYAEKDRAERLRTKSKELHKAVHNMYDRALRKQAARQEELAASGKSEKLRLYGELLFGQPVSGPEGHEEHHRAQLVRRGAKEVTIPLDLRFTPARMPRTSLRTTKRSRPPPGCW